MKKQIDWSGMKFVIAEQLGESMDCYFIRDLGAQKPQEIYVMNHRHHDGVGAMTKLLETYFGYTYQQMPQMKSFEPPSWWQKLVHLWNFIKLTKKLETDWKSPRRDMTGKAEIVGAVFFNREEAQLCEKIAREKGASLNSSLLWALDKVVSDHLLTPRSQRKWVNPINMRGSFETPNPYGNNSASIILNLEGQPKSSEVHQKIRSYFKNRTYIGSWLYTNMAKLIGLKGTMMMAKKIKDLGVGVCSHMGNWPPEGYQTTKPDDPEENWAITAPSSQILPVALAAVQWRGKLSFTLQLHPSLGYGPEKVQQLCDELKEALFDAQAQDKGRFQYLNSQELLNNATRFDKDQGHESFQSPS